MSDDRCCCAICHVKTGTWIIAIVQFVIVMLILIGAVLSLDHVKEDDGTSRYENSGLRWKKYVVCFVDLWESDRS